MKRLMTALASIALIGTLFVGAPKPVFAVGGADTFYVGFGGGSDAGCGVPDYDLDYGREGYWDGDSWEYTNNSKLEDALYEFFDNDGALDVTDGDTIVICDGWFHLHGDGPAWNGDLTPGVNVDPSTITIRGLGVNATVIDGTEPDDADPFDLGALRPFYFRNTNLILEDMTITNTSAVNDGGSRNGGAVFLDGGSLTVDNVDFVNFTSDNADGGAIAVRNGDLTVTNSTFDQTSGYAFYESDYNEGDGGAIFVDATSGLENATVEISDSEFSNLGTQLSGGAIAIGCATTTIERTDFYDNTAGLAGGAIAAVGGGYGYGCDTIGSLTIDQSLFEGNYIHDSFGGEGLGGGAVASFYQPVTVTDSDLGSLGSGNSSGSNARGGAMYIDGTSGTQVTIEDSNFESNYAYYAGGAIYTHCANVEITGDATGTFVDVEEGPTSSLFADNYSDSDGGAVFIGAEGCNDDSGDSSFDEYVDALIDGVTFSTNDADNQGGAVATDQTEFNWLTELEVRSSTFYGNGSENLSQGGALNSDYVDISIYTSYFLGNKASGNGGVVELCGGDLHVEDSIFSANRTNSSGGVAYVSDGCGRNNAGNVTIIGSEFVESGADDEGGVLYMDYGRQLLNITDSEFVDNTSGGYGGAVFASDATTGITNSLFDGNLSEEEGGAINFASANSLTIRGSEFIDNSSGYDFWGCGDCYYANGGAIDFETDNRPNVYLGVFDSLFQGNYATGHGGAIRAENANTLGLFEVARSQFINNTTDDEGGAIRAELDDEGTLTVDRSTFSGNLAWDDGGGISQTTEDEYTLVRITNSRFQDNFADDEGGAMRVKDRTVLTNNTFIGNLTNDDGGAVHHGASYGTIETVPYLLSVTNNTFTNNVTYDDGGALYTGGLVIMTGNKFTGNYGDDDGGAWYGGSGSGRHVVSKNTFASNLAGYWGGAFNLSGDATISSNTFTGNVSDSDGGAIRVTGEQVTITKNNFVGNRSGENGGAIAATELSFPGSSITDNLLDSNSAASNGGAMWIDDDENLQDFKLVIASNRIIRNTANNGAGIYVTFPSGAANVQQVMTGIIRNTFERNIATQNGGGIMMEYRGGAYSNARAALQTLQKALKNNRYKGNKANLDRATGDIGGVAILIEILGVEKVEALETPDPIILSPKAD